MKVWIRLVRECVWLYDTIKFCTNEERVFVIAESLVKTLMITKDEGYTNQSYESAFCFLLILRIYEIKTLTKKTAGSLQRYGTRSIFPRSSIL